MTHTFFKTFFLFLCISTNANAIISFQVYDYDSDGEFIQKETFLDDLISKVSFDGKYFKIVKSKNENPILFKDKEYTLKAAHIYYHLTRARNYYKKLDNINRSQLNKKIIIRLDIKNAFDSYAHFAHDDFSEEYNTAITIPKSDDSRIPHVSSWEEEIWFRPLKEIAIKGNIATIATLMNTRSIKRDLQLVVLQNGVSRLLDNILSNQLFNRFSQNSSFLGIALGIAAIELLPKVLVIAGNRFKQKYYLDTGMIPEIIYHEYSHFVLSDSVPLTSTPVIEGIANYFAGKIGGKALWGNHPRRFSTDTGRNGLANELYSFRTENNLFSTGDFVYKMLWGLQNIFGEKKADMLIYESRDGINQRANIKFDLVNNLFKSLTSIGLDDNNHNFVLHKYLQTLGL